MKEGGYGYSATIPLCHRDGTVLCRWSGEGGEKGSRRHGKGIGKLGEFIENEGRGDVSTWTKNHHASLPTVRMLECVRYTLDGISREILS